MFRYTSSEHSAEEKHYAAALLLALSVLPPHHTPCALFKQSDDQLKFMANELHWGKFAVTRLVGPLRAESETLFVTDGSQGIKLTGSVGSTADQLLAFQQLFQASRDTFESARSMLRQFGLLREGADYGTHVGFIHPLVQRCAALIAANQSCIHKVRN